MTAQLPSLESLDFDRGAMNWAIWVYGSGVVDDFATSNTSTCAFSQNKSHWSLHQWDWMVWGYWVKTPGGLVECPPTRCKESCLSLLQDNRINDRNSSVARDLSEVADSMTKVHMQHAIQSKEEQILGYPILRASDPHLNAGNFNQTHQCTQPKHQQPTATCKHDCHHVRMCVWIHTQI